ncbi:DUF6777 domain-containing protein [Georgenia sp. MJ170]|uniref:DUF6777 domain-containing protein n=1 Tax=Georgenia sunbinii TaxID=3117728 RepID=UPI002F26969E
MSEAAAPTRRSRRPIVIALVVVVAVAGAALVGIRLLRPLEADPPAAAGDTTAVILESATAPGDDPFTDTITARELDDQAPFVETLAARTVEVTQELAADPVTGALGIAGTLPGLYGGSSQLSICDPESLVAFLADEPAKASAWAGVLGIAPEAIPELVASLTPVLLTMDTLVTNHGFAAGAATPKQTVLQAGTAVMVDRLGVPAVRCECGNPLIATGLSTTVAGAETVGVGWDGLNLGRVVTVTAADDDLTALTVIDLHTGELVEQPTGSVTIAAPVYIATSSNHAELTTGPDSPALAGSIQTSTDGAQWTVALETTPMLDVAAGDGLAVAVGLDDEFGGAIHTSTDGLIWSPPIEVIDPLTAVAYGDGAWVAVGDRSFAEESGAGDASSGAIYRSDDGESWQRVAVTDPYENSELAGSGELVYQSMESVGYGDGRWIATATECAHRTCMRVLFTSTDTISWNRLALDERIVLIDIAHNGHEWGFVGGEPLPNPADNSEIGFPIGAGGTSEDGVTWSFGPTQPDRVVLTGLNPGDGEWLAVDAYTPRSPSDPPPAGGVYRSSDMLTWELIGTAAEWTTSVALLQTTTAPAVPAVPAVEPDAGAATVRIMAEGLELLATDGSTLQSLPYAQPATEALAALTGLLGEGSAEFTAGDYTCTEDTTTTAWAGLHLMHAGWWYPRSCVSGLASLPAHH